MDEILKTTESKMGKAVETLEHAFRKLRSGRASPAMIEEIMVSYYGNDTPLNQVASITVEGGRTLLITPWEKKSIPDIEKAIHSSGMGFNPIATSEVVRVPLPATTEENRKEYTRHARHEAEQARISIRNARRDSNQRVKEEADNEDSEHAMTEKIQKLTDTYIATVDKLLQEKESDLMQV